ncbi:MAG: hypothetical protein KGL40_10790 [Rhodocyclaceae bacterium]|nr:hypothetical protein [Rhodocyclaceae bacterium]
MAISWVTVLSAVPWNEVIRNAPRVAEGAKKLWGSTGRKRASAGKIVSDPAVRIEALEASVEELSRQMQASAELIKALAEQNAQLIQRIESNRRRTLGLAALVLLLLAGLIALSLGMK